MVLVVVWVLGSVWVSLCQQRLCGWVVYASRDIVKYGLGNALAGVQSKRCVRGSRNGSCESTHDGRGGGMSLTRGGGFVFVPLRFVSYRD